MIEEITKIRYFDWEGDACRVHIDLTGSETADIYRSGEGHIPISPTDVTYEARQISEKDYKQLVLDEIERAKRENNVMTPIAIRNYRPPRKVEEFVKQWRVPSDEALIFGDGEFDGIQDRQYHILGEMIDASIILHVYEQLKKNAGIKELQKVYLPRLTPDDIKVLTGTDDAEKLKRLVEMSREDREKHKGPRATRILNHDGIASASDRNQYEAAAEQYKMDLRKQYDGTLDDNRIILPPKDPRIKAVNKLISSTVQLYDPGCKTLDSLRSKEKKKAKKLATFRDLNRLAILPNDPKYIEDFIKILELLYPPKEIELPSGKTREIAQTFAEPYEITDYGYFKRNIIAAIDHSDSKGMAGGNGATMAEIKIVPASMNAAEKLSGVKGLQPVLRALEDTTQYSHEAIARGSTKGQIEERRQMLSELYRTQEASYMDILRENGLEKPEYKFPELPKKSTSSSATYDNLKKDFRNLATRLHVDAMTHVDRSWRREYLKTAIFQKLCHKDDKFLSDAQMVQDIDVIRTDNLDNPWIIQVARGDGSDNPFTGKIITSKMETEIRNEISDKWHSFTQEERNERLQEGIERERAEKEKAKQENAAQERATRKR